MVNCGRRGVLLYHPATGTLLDTTDFGSEQICRNDDE